MAKFTGQRCNENIEQQKEKQTTLGGTVFCLKFSLAFLGAKNPAMLNLFQSGHICVCFYGYDR